MSSLLGEMKGQARPTLAGIATLGFAAIETIYLLHIPACYSPWSFVQEYGSFCRARIRGGGGGGGGEGEGTRAYTYDLMSCDLMSWWCSLFNCSGYLCCSMVFLPGR